MYSKSGSIRLMNDMLLNEKTEEPWKTRGKKVVPGEQIADDSSLMRGHGTYVAKESKLFSSVAGHVNRINKLLSVMPLRTKYNGEIGDIVVGRIVEVQPQQKRWKVDTNSRLDSILLLSSVNLPGGELRRKTVEDELMMRSFFTEGDLISAEVQSVFSDGSLSLHTRSLKYGKLGQGVLIRVSPSLVERRKTHTHNLPFGAHIILGNNGFIWISPVIDEGTESGGFAVNLDPVPLSDRETIARLKNCIEGLAKHKVMLYDTSILYCYEFSLEYKVKDLLESKTMFDVCQLTKQKLSMEQ
ncbi:exosome complex component RRP4-like protein [Leptotrombidium deliense]|uniref:Exosome complex component RRP4-like protein n=1 Tax=Leptotrombidium deliense TaxID=299467 RepID=A0A443SA86_9ACAR|nr:exosome complex component RRP4-like protein [Leptotrombidium deliense]